MKKYGRARPQFGDACELPAGLLSHGPCNVYLRCDVGLPPIPGA